MNWVIGIICFIALCFILARACEWIDSWMWSEDYWEGEE